MKNINIQTPTWKNLFRLKMDRQDKTVDATINYLLGEKSKGGKKINGNNGRRSKGLRASANTKRD